jgi:hypothetical protein
MVQMLFKGRENDMKSVEEEHALEHLSIPTSTQPDPLYPKICKQT